jgi:hypothetical protein
MQRACEIGPGNDRRLAIGTAVPERGQVENQADCGGDTQKQEHGKSMVRPFGPVPQNTHPRAEPADFVFQDE